MIQRKHTSTKVHLFIRTFNDATNGKHISMFHSEERVLKSGDRRHRAAATNAPGRADRRAPAPAVARSRDPDDGVTAEEVAELHKELVPGVKFGELFYSALYYQTVV